MVPAVRVGLKGRIGPGHWAPRGPEVKLKNWTERLIGQSSVPGEELGVPACKPQLVGVAIKPRSEANRCSWKSVEGNLGQVGEAGRQTTRRGIGRDRAYELGVDAKAVGGHEEAVLLARPRLADVDGSFRGPSRAEGVQGESADLGVVGATGRAFGMLKLALGVCAGACPSAASGLIVKPSGRVITAVGSGTGRPPLA